MAKDDNVLNRGCADLLILGLLAFLVFWCCDTAAAQESRTLVGPSVEQQRAAFEAADQWRRATKLTYLDAIPDHPTGTAGCLLPKRAKQGDVGAMDGWNFQVLQVLDEEDALLTLGSDVVWLSGWPTADLVDGEAVRLVGPVEVGETKSYNTALGAERTVRVLRLLSGERLAELAAAEKAAADTYRAAAWKTRWEKERRTWTDKSGQHTIEAVYDGFEPGHVWLMKEDRSRVKVPLAKLADADRRKAVELSREVGVESAKEVAPRTWTGAGGFTIRAVFVRIDNGQVTLRRVDDDKEITVKSTQLSAADRQYIDSLK